MKFNGKNIDFSCPTMSFSADLKRPELLNGGFVYLLSYVEYDYEKEEVADCYYIGASADRVVEMPSDTFREFIDCDSEIVLNPFVFLDLKYSQINAMAKCLGIDINDICVEVYSVEGN